MLRGGVFKEPYLLSFIGNNNGALKARGTLMYHSDCVAQ